MSHAVWRRHRFALSFRDVEDLLLGARHHGILQSDSILVSESLDQRMPGPCGDKVGSVTSGTWTSCSSQSAANAIIFGEPLTRMVTSSISWSRATATREPLSASFARISRIRFSPSPSDLRPRQVGASRRHGIQAKRRVKILVRPAQPADPPREPFPEALQTICHLLIRLRRFQLERDGTDFSLKAFAGLGI